MLVRIFVVLVAVGAVLGGIDSALAQKVIP